MFTINTVYVASCISSDDPLLYFIEIKLSQNRFESYPKQTSLNLSKNPDSNSGLIKVFIFLEIKVRYVMYIFPDRYIQRLSSKLVFIYILSINSYMEMSMNPGIHFCIW